jgi:hypothetical protein
VSRQHGVAIPACSTASGQEHTSTAHALQHAQDPKVMEPDKCYEWKWVPFNDVPEPRFAPLLSLLESGIQPSADKAGMHVRLGDVVMSGTGSAHKSHRRSFDRTPDGDVWDTPVVEIAPAVQPSGNHSHHNSTGMGLVVQGEPDPVPAGGPEGMVTLGPTVVPAVRPAPPLPR